MNPRRVSESRSIFGIEVAQRIALHLGYRKYER